MTKEIVHISHYNGPRVPHVSLIDVMTPYVMMYHECMLKLQVAMSEYRDKLYEGIPKSDEDITWKLMR